MKLKHLSKAIFRKITNLFFDVTFREKPKRNFSVSTALNDFDVNLLNK